MFLDPLDAKQITESVLARSRADSCTVTVMGGDDANLRFARNSATTNGARGTLTVKVASHFGQRSGAASVAGAAGVAGRDDDALAEAVKRSEEIARLAPDNPETMPPLGPQTYEAGAAYDEATVGVRIGRLAAEAKPVIDEAEKRSVDVAGFSTVGRGFEALATSAGLFAYDQRTGAQFSVTARNRTGTWSGWAGVADNRFARVDASRLGHRAIDKAAAAAEPVRLDPGKYTVILEPSAVSDLVGAMLHNMNARAADEGRSFFARPGGGNRIGEKLFADNVTIFSDPADPVAPEPLFDHDGVPRRRILWVDGGVLRNLATTRFWARKTDRAPIPPPRTFVMQGGPTSIDDMIADTKRGVLVTRLWYIRMLDRQKLVLTGLTRDGNFLIENGRVAAPARNFRFNESPIAMLANVAAIGATGHTRGGESEDGGVAAPPLLVKDFTFSSVSDAI